MSTETKEKKKRTRRNYQAEMQRLADYCEIKLEVLESLDPQMGTQLNGRASQIEAYRDILGRLNGK